MPVTTKDGFPVGNDAPVYYCTVKGVRYDGNFRLGNLPDLRKNGQDDEIYQDREKVAKRAPELAGQVIESRRRYDFLTRF